MSQKGEEKKQQNQKNDENYLRFITMVEESIERNKNKVVKEVIEIGDDLLEEIDQKKEKRDIEKKEMINYMQTHGVNIEFDEYSYEEIKEKFNKLKRKNRPFLQKLNDLLTNKK